MEGGDLMYVLDDIIQDIEVDKRLLLEKLLLVFEFINGRCVWI